MSEKYVVCVFDPQDDNVSYLNSNGILDGLEQAIRYDSRREAFAEMLKANIPDCSLVQDYSQKHSYVGVVNSRGLK